MQYRFCFPWYAKVRCLCFSWYPEHCCLEKMKVGKISKYGVQAHII